MKIKLDRMKLILSGWLLLTLFLRQVYAAPQKDLDLFPQDKYSAEFKAANVRDVLKSMTEPYQINLLISEDVSGKVTASLPSVYVKEAFLSVLKNAGLGYIYEGNIIRIVTLDSLAVKQKKELAQQEAVRKQKLDVPLITKQIRVNYAFDSERSKDLTELAKTLTGLLSKRDGANISVVGRTNTLVITDIAENITRLEEVIRGLDRKSPQIAIAAKIVEVDSDISREWGIKWGGEYKQDDFTATGSGLTKSSGISGANSALNLPAAVVSGSGGAMGFMIGKIGKSVLDVEISAMEQNGQGRVLATPRVITQDNQTANIESGYEVPYQTIGEAGSFSIEFKEAVVSLKVTPHVIGNQIFMDVEIKRDRVDFTTSAGADNPPLLTKKLNTKVLVVSGETVVIGGLIDHENTEQENGVPILADIPILGWLFKYKSKASSKKELIIFITPSLLIEVTNEEA